MKKSRTIEAGGLRYYPEAFPSQEALENYLCKMHPKPHRFTDPIVYPGTADHGTEYDTACAMCGQIFTDSDADDNPCPMAYADLDHDRDTPDPAPPELRHAIVYQRPAGCNEVFAFCSHCGQALDRDQFGEECPMLTPGRSVVSDTILAAFIIVFLLAAFAGAFYLIFPHAP